MKFRACLASMVAATAAFPCPAGTAAVVPLRGEVMTDILPDRVEVARPGELVRVDRVDGGIGWTTRPGAVGDGVTDGVRVSVITGDAVEPISAIDVAQRRFGGALVRGRAGADRAVWMTIDARTTGHWSIDIVPEGAGVTAIEVSLPLAAGEHVYGGGDAWGTESVSLRGHEVRLWNSQGTPDQCSWVPFFWTNAGYGVFFDEARDGTVNVGAAEPGRWTARFATARLRMHVFTGATPMQILRRYLEFTGMPPLPPDWTLLPQQWRNEGTWDGVWEDVRHHEEAGIPLGAVWLDRPWALGDYGCNDYEFDPERYPDPEREIERLHDLGIRILVWGCDFITDDAKCLAHALDNGFVNRQPTGSGRYHVDFSNPAARAWWKSEIRKALDAGIDGIKLDRGQSLPGDADFPVGGDPSELHNYHAYLMCRTYAEALREAKGADFQFVPRAGWAGTQAWSMKWPGDLAADFSDANGLGSAMYAMQTAALTGFAFWGPDIGGFDARMLDEDTMIRWIQLGAFSPVMQTCGRGEYPAGAWDIGPRAVDAYRFYGQLRAAMLPMLRAVAREAHETGMPMVRPLALIAPDDDRSAACGDEYLFGPDLLVAPVHQPGTARAVYLPRGRWIDAWQPAREIAGPADETVDLPIDRFPLYVRAGAGLPMDLGAAPETGWSRPFAAEATTVCVFPPATDGAGLGRWAATERRGDEIVIRIADLPEEPRPFVRIPLPVAPVTVHLLAPADALVDMPDREIEATRVVDLPDGLAPGSWWWDAESGAAWLRVATSGGAVRVRTAADGQGE